MLKRLKALLMWGDRSPRARRHQLFCLACALIILGCVAYVAGYFAEQSRVRREGEAYRAMYSPAPLDAAAPATPSPTATMSPGATATLAYAPTVTPSPAPTATLTYAPTVTPSPAPTATPAYAPTVTPSPAPTATPAYAPTVTPSPAPTATPTYAPTVTPSPVPTATPTPQPLVVDVPLPTPNEDTIVYALPTNPPPQESFAELLRYNPDTVGYLMVDDVIDQPVVHRDNDNEYYLDHAFSGAEAREGTLFLDGANRLGDANLIVYGHNMRNGTMFGMLSSFGSRDFLRENAVVRFDTLYENALYVPFAMFEASMDEDDGHYFDVRQIVFDETSFELYVLKLRGRSVFDIPVDVSYGDQLLTLVTCSYNDDDGRYIVALRRLRPGETEGSMRALVAGAL